MTEKLTDEQLHAMAESFNNPRVRAAATALLALRAERAKLEAALGEAQPYVEWMEGTVTDHVSKLKVRALLAKIATLAPACGDR